MQVKISFVIPVFNSENHITRCIESIQDQEIAELEIICVDDCSIDSSKMILHELSRKDERIIHLKTNSNSGPGVCRNIGILRAKSETIRFVDADDILPKNSIKEPYNYLKAHKLQAVKGAYLKKNKNNKDTYVKLKDKGFIVNKDNATDDQIETLLYDHWCYLFDLNFLKNEKLFYPEIRNAQDSIFIQNCILKMKRFGYMPKLVYEYKRYGTSIMSKRDNPTWYKNIFLEKFNLFKTLLILNRQDLAAKMMTDAFSNYFDLSIFPGLIRLDKREALTLLDYFTDAYKKLNIYESCKSYINKLDGRSIIILSLLQDINSLNSEYLLIKLTKRYS